MGVHYQNLRLAVLFNGKVGQKTAFLQNLFARYAGDVPHLSRNVKVNIGFAVHVSVGHKGDSSVAVFKAFGVGLGTRVGLFVGDYPFLIGAVGNFKLPP